MKETMIIKLNQLQQEALERAILAGAVISPELLQYFSRQKPTAMRQAAEGKKSKEQKPDEATLDIDQNLQEEQDDIFSRNSKILILPIDGSLLI